MSSASATKISYSAISKVRDGGQNVQHPALTHADRRRRHWMAAAVTTWSSLAHSVLSHWDCLSSSRLVIHVLYTFYHHTL